MPTYEFHCEKCDKTLTKSGRSLSTTSGSKRKINVPRAAAQKWSR